MTIPLTSSSQLEVEDAWVAQAPNGLGRMHAMDPTPPPSAPARLAPGTLVGPWRVLALAGRGVHGEVYRAVRADLNRRRQWPSSWHCGRGTRASLAR